MMYCFLFLVFVLMAGPVITTSVMSTLTPTTTTTTTIESTNALSVSYSTCKYKSYLESNFIFIITLVLLFRRAIVTIDYYFLFSIDYQFISSC